MGGLSGYWNTITWTPEMVAVIVKMRAERKSAIKIGEELGVSDRAVKSQLTRMGMPTTLPPLKPGPEVRPIVQLMRQATLPLPGPPVPTAAPTQCQYALNDSRPWSFCCAPTVYRRKADGSMQRTAWCREHIERVYVQREAA